MESIEQFYNAIETWMKSIPDLKIIHEAIELEEKNKGCFNIERMIIKAGKKNAVLKPVETVIMGVHASLELQGDNGIVKFPFSIFLDKRQIGERAFPCTYRARIELFEDGLGNKSTGVFFNIDLTLYGGY